MLLEILICIALFLITVRRREYDVCVYITNKLLKDNKKENIEFKHILIKANQDIVVVKWYIFFIISVSTKFKVKKRDISI